MSVGGVCLSNREFTVTNEYHYNRSSPIRWIISHVLRYKRFIASFALASLITNTFYATVPILTGAAFTAVLQGKTGQGQLIRIVLLILTVVLVGGVVDLTARLSSEILGKRLATDARAELYAQPAGQKPDLPQSPARGRHYGPCGQRYEATQRHDCAGR